MTLDPTSRQSSLAVGDAIDRVEGEFDGRAGIEPFGVGHGALPIGILDGRIEQRREPLALPCRDECQVALADGVVKSRCDLGLTGGGEAGGDRVQDSPDPGVVSEEPVACRRAQVQETLHG